MSHEGKRTREIFLQRLEFGDLLIYLYILALVRQYFWIIENNAIAWTLSIGLSGVATYFYITTRKLPSEKTSASFWVIVGLPLLIAYLFRGAFPDQSYDVLNYRLLHAARTLRGPLYALGDFFPTALPFNPVADTLTGITRMLLGFRLGTIINLLALLWTAQIVDRILRRFVSQAWLRLLCVLMVVLIENVFFEISTYMVDILTLPLMLQATLLILNDDYEEERGSNSLHIALLLGLSVAFKLTNLAVVLPILTIHAYQLIVGPKRIPVKDLLITAAKMLVLFVAPVLPFTLYIYRLTGNPVFPAANVFFKSPYWPTHGGWDDRWGPHGVGETIVWPVLAWFKPERYSELGVYSGRLSFGFIVALCGLALMWRNSRVRLMCILLVSSALLWSALAMGYSRYGLFGDVLSGIALFAIAATLAGEMSWRKLSWGKGVAAILCAVIVAQTVMAVSYGVQKDWGLRPSILANSSAYFANARLLLRDRSLREFVADEDRARFDSVDVWLETGRQTTGLEVLLNHRAPVIAVRQEEFFVTRESWKKFSDTVKTYSDKKMYSLCFTQELPAAKRDIALRGLEIGKITPILVPFFSRTNQLSMMLIEISLPQDPVARNNFETAWMKAAFASADYNEEIIAINATPSVMTPGQKLDLQFKVRNLGSETWPATGDKDHRYLIDMGNRWIRSGVVSEDSRALLSSDLPPGGETEMKLTVTAPTTPGEYTLEIDMVHEGVSWFKERGADPLRIRIKVQP